METIHPWTWLLKRVALWGYATMILMGCSNPDLEVQRYKEAFMEGRKDYLLDKTIETVWVEQVNRVRTEKKVDVEYPSKEYWVETSLLGIHPSNDDESAAVRIFNLGYALPEKSKR